MTDRRFCSSESLSRMVYSMLPDYGRGRGRRDGEAGAGPTGGRARYNSDPRPPRWVAARPVGPP